MRKYKLNRTHERTVPSDAMVNKYKNFDKMRAQYEDVVRRPKTPLYKNKKLFLFIIIVGILAWLVAEAIEVEENSEQIQQTIERWTGRKYYKID